MTSFGGSPLTAILYRYDGREPTPYLQVPPGYRIFSFSFSVLLMRTPVKLHIKSLPTFLVYGVTHHVGLVWFTVLLIRSRSLLTHRFHPVSFAACGSSLAGSKLGLPASRSCCTYIGC